MRLLGFLGYGVQATIFSVSVFAKKYESDSGSDIFNSPSYGTKKSENLQFLKDNKLIIIKRRCDH